jgi:hypothetical protein
MSKTALPASEPGTTYLAMAVHNHQPVDNDSGIIEEVYQSSYRPFLTALNAFPSLNVNLHYSGYLLEWLEERHPEFISLAKSMVSRGQVEMLGGGYYEPILPCIPTEDALGQIGMLREKLHSVFGVYPEGLWTPERVWEPQSPELLEEAGVRYTLLDDTIFMLSGVGEDERLEPHLVESRGAEVTVFPMMKKLRYIIPWRSPGTTISFLRGIASTRGPAIAVFGDDGEKFGAWPTTYEKVYTRRWLERFFALLTENRRWLKPIRFSDYLGAHPAHRSTYLHAASYDEMSTWSLPNGRADPATRRRARGYWRIFLSKYPESARLYSRMLGVSKSVNAVAPAKEEALRELWKGQFNDVYWHGVFGGLYSPVLRRIAYHHLIRAQTLVEASSRGGEDWLSVKTREFRGRREHIVDTRQLRVCISPWEGGSVSELDFKPPGLNVLDVLARRKEPFHDEMTKRTPGLGRPASRGAGLGQRMTYDRHPRFSFQDFLMARRDATIKNLLHQDFDELVPLAGEPYSVRPEISENSAIFSLSRTCRLGTGVSFHVEKEVRVRSRESGLACSYRVGTDSPSMSKRYGFAIELNISSLGDPGFKEANSSRTRRVSSRGTELSYPAFGASLSLEFSKAVELFQLPVLTVSRSEKGFELSLQGVSIVGVVGLPGEASTQELEVRLSLRSR